MHAMTAANLQSAFGGESMAHMRYKIWADKADKDGFPNVARLFRAVSRAEQAHATGHFRVLADVSGPAAVTAGGGFGLGSTAENLAGAIEGETFEINEMYPAYLAVAQAQDEKGAVRSITYAEAAEKIHAAMFTEAKQSVDAGKDYDIGTIQICALCGHTMAANEAPENCPVCGARKNLYIAFS
jgi:rubrerythrin